MLMMMRAALQPLHDRMAEATEEESEEAGMFRLALEWLCRFLLPVYWTLHVATIFFEFIVVWWCSRNHSRLAYSTPALALGMSATSIMILTGFYSNLAKIKHYRVALATATELRNRTEESLCLRKLYQLGYQRMERAEFETAIALAEDGEFQPTSAMPWRWTGIMRGPRGTRSNSIYITKGTRKLFKV